MNIKLESVDDIVIRENSWCYLPWYIKQIKTANKHLVGLKQGGVFSKAAGGIFFVKNVFLLDNKSLAKLLKLVKRAVLSLIVISRRCLCARTVVFKNTFVRLGIPTSPLLGNFRCLFQEFGKTGTSSCSNFICCNCKCLFL